MAVVNPERGSTLEPQKGYKRVIWGAGFDDSDYSRNEEQGMQDLERWRLQDSLWVPGAVISGLEPSIVFALGVSTVTFPDGSIAIRERIYPVPGVALVYTGALTSQSPAYLRWALDQIGKSGDPELVNPNTNDPVTDRYRVLCSLVSVNPDALDEDFEFFVQSGDHTKPVLLNGGTPPIIPVNPTYGAWVVQSGAPAMVQIGAPRFEVSSLQLNHVNGVDSILKLPGVLLKPNTNYFAYISVRTVYGQLDLSGSNSPYLSISRTNGSSPLVSTFPTTGGATLLGDFVEQVFSFASDSSASPVDILIGIPAAAPSTQIMFDVLLITATPKTELARHYDLIFQGTDMHQVNVPRSRLFLTDLDGDIPANRVTYVPNTHVYHDISTTVPTQNVQSALDELTDQRALLNGDPAETFEALSALESEQVPPSVQIQDGGLTFAADTGVANAYVIALLPPITAYVEGMSLAFKPLHANTGASTLNAGNGPIAILRADGTPLIQGDIKIGQVSRVTFVGAVWQLLRQPVIGLPGFRNLRGFSSGPSLNITADQAILRNPQSDELLPIDNFSAIGVATGPQGLNGKDTSGALPAGWVHLYAIGGSGVAPGLIFSATGPPTGPTLPAGYSSWAYIATLSNTAIMGPLPLIVPVFIRGNKVYYQQYVNIVTADQGKAVAQLEQAVSLDNIVPPQALEWIAAVIADLGSPTAGNCFYNVYPVSGSPHFVRGFVAATASGGNGTDAQIATIPYISNQIYYIWDTFFSIAPADHLRTTINVIGYNVPNDS